MHPEFWLGLYYGVASGGLVMCGVLLWWLTRHTSTHKRGGLHA